MPPQIISRRKTVLGRRRLANLFAIPQHQFGLQELSKNGSSIYASLVE
jgi:hypothetical protein